MAKDKKGYMALSQSDKNRWVAEEFKGEVTDLQVTFPRGLGAKHPFEFEDLEKLTKKYGPVNEIVSKTASEVVGDFTVKLDNENAQALIDSFLADTNFLTVADAWVREALLKGNGFIELDLENNKIRVMNANNMYVKRNKKGQVKEYNQWTKPFKMFSMTSKELVTFKPNEIAHLTINKVPNDPYGIGIIYPNEQIIENLVKSEQDQQKLISRKAGAPYHVKVGEKGKVTPQPVVDAVKTALQFQTTRTEWVTDADVEITNLDFKDLGKSLVESEMYFWRRLLSGTGMPEVLMGSGQLNEGIAKVQLQSRRQAVKSLQTKIEAVIEEKIIRPLLRANGLDEKPEFVWELPSEEQKNEKIERLMGLLDSKSMASAEMRAAVEIQIAELMGDDDLLDVLKSPSDAQAEAEKEKEELKKAEAEDRTADNPKEERPAERKKEEQIKQPEVPGAKKTANESFEKDSTIKEWVNLQEIAGFNYTDYLVKILNALKNDEFEFLSAKTERDLREGLLPQKEIEKLRVVLKNGFRENKPMLEIEQDIRDNVKLNDRTKGDKLIFSAAARPSNIARTETVRLSNVGLVDLFKENKIEKVRWLAALSDRTCPICEELNGKVWKINRAEMPPAHSLCRCSLLSVLE